MESVGGVDRHSVADQLLDAAQEIAFTGRTERNGVAPGPGPGGAADAVDVYFGFHGQVIVDDMGNAVHVQPAGGDIGGDQHADAAVLEAGQRLGAGALALVAVDGGGR